MVKHIKQDTTTLCCFFVLNKGLNSRTLLNVLLMVKKEKGKKEKKKIKSWNKDQIEDVAYKFKTISAGLQVRSHENQVENHKSRNRGKK
jgi:hypothetical protein